MKIGLKRGPLWWIEPLMALGIVAGIIHSLIFLHTYSYLPQPFFYDSSDTWMDWMNSAKWSHIDGAYDVWGTVYPPLTFIFLRLTSLPKCYVDGGSFEPRDCDWASIATLNGWMLFNCVLLGFIFYKHDKNTWVFRTIGAAFGMPMLTGWERGQVFMVCFTCFILAHGPLIRSTKLRWIFAGLSINFKVYLITSLFAYLARRRWQWFEGGLIATIAIYLITLAIYGRGSPIEIYQNITAFTQQTSFVDSFLDIWTGATYSRIYAFATSAGPVVGLVGSARLDLIALVVPILVHSAQMLLVLASVAIFFRPETVPTFRAINLLTCLALITSEAGDYSIQLVIFLTFLERWQGLGRISAIFVSYVLCIPADIYVDRLMIVQRAGFLNGPPVFYEFWVVYGPFIRPGLLIFIGVALALTTIKTVWRDVRTQGWKHRHRARFDLQFLKSGGRVQNPPTESPSAA